MVVSRYSRLPRSYSGFTLLELVVVLFILALVTALVAPAFSRSFGQVQLKAAARDIVALCRFARTQAITSQNVVEVVLDRRTSSYWLTGSNGTVGSLGSGDAALAQDTAQPVPSGQSRLRTLPAGVTLRSVVLETGPIGEDERGAIVFFPQGSSTGGEIWLADNKGRGYRIVVDPSVGFIRLSAAENT